MGEASNERSDDDLEKQKKENEGSSHELGFLIRSFEMGN